VPDDRNATVAIARARGSGPAESLKQGRHAQAVSRFATSVFAAGVAIHDARVGRALPRKPRNAGRSSAAGEMLVLRRMQERACASTDLLRVLTGSTLVLRRGTRLSYRMETVDAVRVPRLMLREARFAL
jgi:hypothetical protein